MNYEKQNLTSYRLHKNRYKQNCKVSVEFELTSPSSMRLARFVQN